MPERQARDRRTTIFWIASVIAAAMALIQRTSVAPFPHAADDFLAGFAIGAGIASLIIWVSSRG